MRRVVVFLPLDAERKMGEMLAVKPHPSAERFVPGKGTEGATGSPSATPTNKQLGVSKKESAAIG